VLGVCFRQRIMDYFKERIKLKHNVDVTGNARALAKLR
jgi:molecular chaperone DnaK (HSP70)